MLLTCPIPPKAEWISTDTVLNPLQNLFRARGSWVRSYRGRCGSPRGVLDPQGAHLDRAAPQENRAALGKLGSGIQRAGLNNGIAANDVFGFHERAIGNDFFRVDHAPFRLQPVARIEQPAFLKSFSDPGLPLLAEPLHLLG